MKKVIVFIICALLTLGLLPAAVFAADGTSDVPDIYECDEYGNMATWLDWFYWNGEQVTPGGREAIDYYMDNRDLYNVDTRETCGFMGWACFYEPIVEFGYILNDEIVTSEDFYFGPDANLSSTVEEWWPGAGELVKRYMVTVPIAGLHGTNEIVVIAVLENGDIVKLNSEMQEGARNTTIEFEFDPDPDATPTEEPKPTPEPEPTDHEDATEIPEINDDPTEIPDITNTEAPEGGEATMTPLDPPSVPTAEPKNSGCGGIAGGALSLIAAAAVSVILIRRKKK